MKKHRFSENQIFQILKEAEAGTTVTTLCEKHGMSSASFYLWRSKFRGMDTTSMAKMRELEEENSLLKKMYAESQMGAEILRSTLKKKRI